MKNLNSSVCRGLVQLGAWLGLACVAQAQTVTELELAENTRRWVLAQTSQGLPSSAAAPLRVEVVLGVIDSRLRLAPCSQVQPYVPPGSALWGRTRVGLRCLAGETKWNVFVPVTVRAWGLAWVLRRDVPAGVVLTQSDGMAAEVDWADEASPVLAESPAWIGQVATRSLRTGQTLRQDMVRAAQVFQAGAQIRVVARGLGFQASADGQAMTSGVVGQLVRVKLDSGRMMSGTVLDARTVQVEM